MYPFWSSQNNLTRGILTNYMQASSVTAVSTEKVTYSQNCQVNDGSEKKDWRGHFDFRIPNYLRNYWNTV